MSSVRAHSKQMAELGQVFRWSAQLGQLVRWSTQISCQIYPPNKMMCTDGRIRSSFQMKCPTRSTCQMKCSDILPIIRWHVQMSMSFSDEVFMFSCCIGNISSCTLSTLCRSLCVVVVVTISCCCPVIVLVLVQLHMSFNNNNNNNNNNFT